MRWHGIILVWTRGAVATYVNIHFMRMHNKILDLIEGVSNSTLKASL